MSRIVNHFLNLNQLRKFLGNANFFRSMRSNFKLTILSSPPKGNVLVLSPHPDDDIFGCGGTLALHRKQKDDVKIIYFSSNLTGYKPAIPASPAGERNSKYAIREKEAAAAAKILKIDDIEFWQLPDSKFVANRSLVARLSKLIRTYQPDLIYVPTFTDANPDHYEVAKLLYYTIAVIASHPPNRRMTKQSARLPRSSSNDDSLAMTNSIHILLYEVWTPLFANRLIKIDKTVKQKKAAIKCHSSQLRDRAYCEAILGLNAYRAGMFSAGNYAEAFSAMNPKLYLKMFDVFNLK